MPAGELAKGVIKTWIILFGGGAVLVLLAVGLADRLGRSIVRPLLALDEVTHRLRDGDLEQRYEPAGPYEVAEVGQAVNELADRINGLIASTRLAAADLGHRLRTPLTALRLDIEAIAAENDRTRLAAALESVETAVSRLIEETRQAPKPSSRRADLSQAVRDQMAFWSLLAKSQRRQVDVRAPARRVDVSLSRDELDVAIDALLGMGLDIVRRTAMNGGGAAEVGRSASGGHRVEVKLPLAPDA
jgi:signal transduction histidine kinase